MWWRRWERKATIRMTRFSPPHHITTSGPRVLMDTRVIMEACISDENELWFARFIQIQEDERIHISLVQSHGFGMFWKTAQQWAQTFGRPTRRARIVVAISAKDLEEVVSSWNFRSKRVLSEQILNAITILRILPAFSGVYGRYNVKLFHCDFSPIF